MKKTLYLFISFLLLSFSFAQNLEPDTTFGTNGVMLGEENYGWERIRHVVQPDGKIIVSGHKFSAGINPPDCSMDCIENIITRYNSDGTIDTSFGTNGTYTFPSNNVDDNGPDGLALYNDGSIIVIREFTTGGNHVNEISKLTSSGSLDTSFGNNGFIQVPNPSSLAEDYQYYHLDVANSSIYILEDDTNLKIHKYNLTGNLDTSFANSGRLELVLPNKNVLSGFIPTNDNSVLLIFYEFFTADRVHLEKFGNDGTKDNSFGTVIVSEFVQDYFPLIDAQNKLVISYLISEATHVKRFNLDGSIDNSFGTNGEISFPESHEYAPYLSEDNNVYLIGGIYDNPTTLQSKLAIVKLNNDGSLNSSFADNGTFISNNETLSLGESATIKNDYILISSSDIKVEESPTDNGLQQQVLSKFNFNNLGTSEIENQSSVKLNTIVENELVIQSSNEIQSITVFNNQGKLIQTIENSINNRFDLTQLNSGLYIVNIEFENGRKLSKKILKKN